MTDSPARPIPRRDVLRLLPLAAMAFAASCASSTRGAGVFEISGEMPPLAGPALLGGTVDRSSYAGRPVIVNFWATWCGPCRREQPVLSAAQRAAGPDGPAFIGVNFRDYDTAQARAYLREFDVGYPSIQDRSGSVAYDFDVPFLPATIFVDASGQMRYRAVGALTRGTLDRLIRDIAPASPTPS